MTPHLDLTDLVAAVNGGTVTDGMRGHLATCQECRTEADQWSSVAAGARLLASASTLPPLRLPPQRPARRPARKTPPRTLGIAAAVTVLAIGGLAYGLASGPQSNNRPAAAIGLSAVNGCPGLAAALGIVQRTDPANLVIRTPGSQPVTVTVPRSAQVSRAVTGSVSDLTDGTRAFVRGVYAGRTVVAHSITVGVASSLPSPAIGPRTPAPSRPWIGAGTVGQINGRTFVLELPGSRRAIVTAPASAAIYSLTRTTPSQLGAGDYVVAVGKPGPDGTLVAATVEAGTALPHNRGTGISGLPDVGCKSSAIAAVMAG